MQLVSSKTRIWTKGCLVPLSTVLSGWSHRAFGLTSFWSSEQPCEGGRAGRWPQFAEEKTEDQRSEMICQVNPPMCSKTRTWTTASDFVLWAQCKLSIQAPQFWKKNILNFGGLTSEVQQQALYQGTKYPRANLIYSESMIDNFLPSTSVEWYLVLTFKIPM